MFETKSDCIAVSYYRSLSRAILEEFYNSGECKHILVSDTIKLAHTLAGKINPNSKVLVIYKKTETIEKENLRKSFTVHEFVPDSNGCARMNALLNGPFLQVFCNPYNQRKWGEVQTSDLSTAANKLHFSSAAVEAQTRGEVALPRPMPDLVAHNALNKEANKNVTCIATLESGIANWSKYMQKVLSTEPEGHFREGKHPTPDVEIEFWNIKAKKLDSILKQLQSNEWRQRLHALKKAESTYYEGFQKLCKDTYIAYNEAKDNVKFMAPLAKYLEPLDLESVDLDDLRFEFPLILQCILMIWKHSKYYNTDRRISVLIQCICNALIQRVQGTISGQQLFDLLDNEEVRTGLIQLVEIIAVCDSLRETVRKCVANSAVECPANPWTVHDEALCDRLDAFRLRCSRILELFQTIVQFSRLPNVSMGGLNGAQQTNSTLEISHEFQRSANAFRSAAYSLFDVDAKQFDDDYKDFQSLLKGFEQRVASIISHGIDDTAPILGKFKVLDAFGRKLLSRPTIAEALVTKKIAVINCYCQDLNKVKKIFVQYHKNVPALLARRVPPIAASIMWCRGLRGRIEGPMEKIRALEQDILEQNEAVDAFRMYSSIVKVLDEYEVTKTADLMADVEANADEKLHLPLMTNLDSQELSTNFDPCLVRLLQEIKYLKSFGIGVSVAATKLFDSTETFREWRLSLDYVAKMYNESIKKLRPIESPLLSPSLSDFRTVIHEGLTTLNWASIGVEPFVTRSTTHINNVHSLLHKTHLNFEAITAISAKWDGALMDRSSAKPVDREDFEDDLNAKMQVAYKNFEENGDHIHSLVESTREMFGCQQESSEWKSYLEFVDRDVANGLSKAVKKTLDFFSRQISPDSIDADGKLPLIEIRLRLDKDNLVFSPPVMNDVADNVILATMKVARVVKRVGCGESFIDEVQQHSEVQKCVSRIQEQIKADEKLCTTMKHKYEKYSDLWATDLKKTAADFFDNASNDSSFGTKELDLAQLSSIIEGYSKMGQDIAGLQTPHDIGWLRIDLTPVKEAMSNLAERWREEFISAIQCNIVDSIHKYHGFVKSMAAGLDQPECFEEKENALKDVMSVIRDLKKSQVPVQCLIQRQQDCVRKLRSWNSDPSSILVNDQTIQDFLEDAPTKWEALLVRSASTKERLQPLQDEAAENLKADVRKFNETIKIYQEEFRGAAPFDCQGGQEAAKEQIAHIEEHLEDLKKSLQGFRNQEELFELEHKPFPALQDMCQEADELGRVWGFRARTETVYESWKGQFWSEAKTSDLEDQTKELKKSLAGLGKSFPAMKKWPIYVEIDSTLKDMGTVLPLVDDLHSPAMRRRHWLIISELCKVDDVNPTETHFLLGTILALKLHNYKAQVEEVVETATKELLIENKLRVMKTCWAKMTLDFDAHGSSGVEVPRPSEELLEKVEEHQTELQSIFAMGKSMNHFKDEAETWQCDLGCVDETLKQWSAVTKGWGSLESIFLTSEDIRAQLPNDTKRFEGVDAHFRKLMTESVQETNCIRVCKVEGRLQTLKGMRGDLELCQKSLNEYLKAKKNIFPRFYFVSDVDLLDMLANGKNPPKIIPHLKNCYNALQNLIFVQNDDGSTSSTVVDTMVEEDGERVALAESFTMEGEVEIYLNQLTLAMMRALKIKLFESLEKASSWGEENPRDQWLFNFPAQLCITGSQIMWTYETQQALIEYEGGQDDAVKKYYQLCKERLAALIQLALGELTSTDRTKIINLITMDVHSRDVLEKLVTQKVEGPQAFAWQQQLRFESEPSTNDVNVSICDFSCKYFYEWVGNTERLVVTPLTDRCYMTLTMALKLNLGGAPAGPAGTGKTETTKDLARALAIPCYVSNCSDQMNIETMADFFRGLAQTGAWGCFDEFNRISIEVLSVVATQVKTILDAIAHLSRRENRDVEFQGVPEGAPPQKVGYFEFEGGRIALVPTCGFWITMNPGYAGRTELPENLKIQFRSCAMIRPDMRLIQENKLMAEGYQNAAALSVKFNTLYELSSSLLSKQPHYDWGMRAVKSVLRVAGKMKRDNPDLDESQVLMRALRDFNMPKIPENDAPIFLRLVNDLFIGMEVESKVDVNLELKVRRAAKNRNLQQDEMFVTKTCNFQDLLDVRHSVMLLGPAGSAKTTIWQTLQEALNLDSEKHVCISETVNPKAVTCDELYGSMSLSKEWRDGVISIIMRGMSKNDAGLHYHEHQTSKWVVLDGDIDAEWIESMNTVMDDNKVLTLVSNERVQLTPAMRLVFEINTLKNATPATASRAGILYINESDVGWKPLVETWVSGRKRPMENNLSRFFEGFVDDITSLTRRGFKEVTNVRVINKVTSLIHLLEDLLPRIEDENLNLESLEMVFVAAAMWAFGGAMIADKSEDYRQKFSNLIREKFGAKIPNEGQCFDYFYCTESGRFLPWKSKVPKFVPRKIGNGAGETRYDSLFVESVETVRMSYLLDKYVRNGKHVMLAGSVGTGKTRIIQTYLDRLHSESDEYLSNTITLSYFTSSLTLQRDMEGSIDKRSGNVYGPPMGKKMVFFMDDVNLPEVEKYGTQTSIALLTQHIQYGSIFDRDELGTRKKLTDIQYVSAMNPSAGSFDICERCQRHFSTFSVSMPSTKDLQTIFGSIFGGHLEYFGSTFHDFSTSIVQTAALLHNGVLSHFLPSSVKFMYNWNMRDLSSIFQGCCRIQSQQYCNKEAILQLFVHEAQRVYSDRLTSEEEVKVFDSMLKDALVKELSEEPLDTLLSSRRLYSDFVPASGGAYLPAPFESLQDVLRLKMEEYGEAYSPMQLVLFEDAVGHVARICRIIQAPGGHAMLIGVGGSGKQSLARLAAFVVGYGVTQLPVTSKFTINDLKEELKKIFITTGCKGEQLVLLITDAQIVDEIFLVFINSILATGWVSNLFTKEEMEQNIGKIASEAKKHEIEDTFEARAAFFIARVQSNLHLVLAFSPVGDVFCRRARRFPGLVNCTGIDQFLAWPQSALEKVAEELLLDSDIDLECENEDKIRVEIAKHVAYQHLSVLKASVRYLKTQRRHNHVTPKSFIELLKFYLELLKRKQASLTQKEGRLRTGLNKLKEAEGKVEDIKQELEITLKIVAEKKANTDSLVEEVLVKQKHAKEKSDAAQIEADKANAESGKAEELKANADEKLKLAEPAMEKANLAVNGLNKSSLTELKNLGKPPEAVLFATGACLILLEKEYNPNKHKWDRAKKMMHNIDAFMEKLRTFEKEKIEKKQIDKLKELYLEHKEKGEVFKGDAMKSKSVAAANLSDWVNAIAEWYQVYTDIVPLRASASEAEQRSSDAQERFNGAQETKMKAEAEAQTLEAKYNAALEDKEIVEQEAEKLNTRASNADRLVKGLANEKARWGVDVKQMQESAKFLAGDCLLAAGFVSYLGAFDQDTREELWKNEWKENLETCGSIEITPNCDPLSVLTDPERNATMVEEGLPSDRVSLENGSVVTNCLRWPLIIDPQVQGIKWLKNREEKGDNELRVIQLSSNKWIGVLKNAMADGASVIIENVSEQLDPTLDPILARTQYEKGGKWFIKFLGEELPYDPSFKLFLQSKLANPHYKPEIFAQCTVVNFIATERGLEDQLLARTVGIEQCELEMKAKALTEQALMNQIDLVRIENQILESLANSGDDIVSDIDLIEGLEEASRKKKEINKSEIEAQATQKTVTEAREVYRPQASEGAMLYFLLTKLCAVDHMYQYSLDSFVSFFIKSIDRADASDVIVGRVESLRKSLRLTIYTWISRGLFERHKLILMSQITFNLLKRQIIGQEEWNEPHFQFLLKGPKNLSESNPLTWLPDSSWYSVLALSENEEFSTFKSDLIEASPRFREWFDSAAPEHEKLPLDWSKLDRHLFKKMMVLRCLRPDRMMYALNHFVCETLPDGAQYTECDSAFNGFEILEQCYRDSSPSIPMYFILSPGANIGADLDTLASAHDVRRGISLHFVSMGQGQDVVAMSRLDTAQHEGHWVVLDNIHLMPNWLPSLEKKLDKINEEGSHDKFRVFLTSDPSKGIPVGLLSRCIKLTNEPPTGLKANLKRAWLALPKDGIEECDPKTKSILFGLCYFHSVMMERKTFGKMGFNRAYPFSIGDLQNSSTCLHNYMENSSGGKVPWQDLKYIFGEIMYGGHITDDFDRLLTNEYLNFYMKDGLLEESELFPFATSDDKVSFMSPIPTSFDKYLRYIDTNVPGETPVAFGLHPNAEIDFKTQQCVTTFETLIELQPREDNEEGDVATPEQKAESVATEILDKIEDKKFDIEEVKSSLDEVGPYQNFFFQEMDFVNCLLLEMKRSIKELQLGLSGELTMSDAMQDLMMSLYTDKLPPSWAKRSWKSLRSLASWMADFEERLKQLEEWMDNPGELPRVTWVGGLVNPTSFLTAICQVTAQKNGWELDKLVTFTEVTKRMDKDEIDAPSREGAYIVGLNMQGARWNLEGGHIERSLPKEMFCRMPVMNVKAVKREKAMVGGIYSCPVYTTEDRGDTWFFNAQLKTKSPRARWTLAGTALIADVA
jgi:dynein heavy chain